MSTTTLRESDVIEFIAQVKATLPPRTDGTGVEPLLMLSTTYNGQPTWSVFGLGGYGDSKSFIEAETLEQLRDRIADANPSPEVKRAREIAQLRNRIAELEAVAS